MTTGSRLLFDVLNNAHYAVWVVTPDLSKTIFANIKFRTLFDIDLKSEPASIETKECANRIEELFNTEKWARAGDGLAFERLRDNHQFDMILPSKDGRHFKLEKIADNLEYTVVNVTDVTRLKSALDNAKLAEKAKTQFLANMSHEIRTPMNGVVGMAQVLAGSSLDERQRECVGVINRSGEALVAIINDILDFSKLESGLLAIDTQHFDIGKVIDDVVVLLSATARSKGVELVLDMPSKPCRLLSGDPGRLRQVLINLIGNAIKFTPNGVVSLGVHMRREGTDARVKFSVTDTGIGIPKKSLKTIFGQFQQADNSTTREFGGTGLGLSISQQLVQLQGGKITVQSEVGKGSKFCFELKYPISDVSLNASPEFAKLENTPILFVDDIKINHMVMQDQLKMIGATAVCVSSGPAALKVLRKAAEKSFQFPLIISDYQMPGMDGLEFVRQLRQDPTIQDTKVMILSSVDTGQLKSEFANLGVSKVFEKPCLSKDLHRSIFEILSNNSLAELSTKLTEMTRVDMTGHVDIEENLKVLIADDDEVNRMVIKQMLHGAPYELVFVENGCQAIEQFKDNRFNLILMDISMPVMGGQKATLEIRKIEALKGLQRTPIIAATAHALKGDKEKFFASGMDDYISKPLDYKVLQNTIQKWTTQSEVAA